MTHRSVADPREAAAQHERELLGRLGLGPGASNEQIEAAHDEVVQYLEAAPGALKAWSRRHVAAADEAYALLRGPRADLVAAALAAAPAGPASPALATQAAAAAPEPGEPEDWLEETDLEVQMKGRSRRGAQRRAPAAVATQRLMSAPKATGNRTLRRLAIGVVSVVAVGAIALVGYNLGAPAVPGFTGTPAPESSQAAVDQAQVTALMQKLAANPKDIATLQSLGDLYYAAGDYATAATWSEKILEVDPNNLNALLALGAANYNVGDLASAETEWLKVVALDPNNVEAHYDLGFVYLGKTPPDMAQVKAEWNKVIQIAPDSDAAKQVATHLASLDATPSPGGSAAPSASPAPSPSTAPSASPAASPAASPSPSAS